MITIRKADERGRTRIAWLDSRHSFSFAGYRDPTHMGFRSLRVINDDVVAPGAGFGTHPHADMEIVTYVLDGILAHRDSTGGGGVLAHGDVQVMSAGTGIEHSEFNGSPHDPARFLQVWILPARRGVQPSYLQRRFPIAERRGSLVRIAAPHGTADADGALPIHQDATISAAVLARGDGLRHAIGRGRHAWLQVARGALDVNGHDLATGDGLAASDERELVIGATEDAEILLFDLS